MNVLARHAAGPLFITLFLPLTALANTPQPTHEFMLDNGLKVIVREDHRAPVVASQIWYKVGSSYETPGQTGLSHALEHMTFKGSKKVGPGQASLILRNLGAKENAGTDDDYTYYYQVLARDRLKVVFELEAERMANALLPADEFSREIEVIKEERRMRTEDNPAAKAYERFQAMAYPSSGYRTPTIGWMADLDRMTIEELRQWYASWYAPNNATLVVVGDVQLDEVKALAQRFFGPIARRDVPPSKKPLELAEPGERQLTLHLKTPFPNLIYGFNVPSLTTAENLRSIYALRLIGGLLNSDHGARFATLRREDELVSSAYATYNSTLRGDALFVIHAQPNPQKKRTLAEVETGIWRLLNELKTTPPGAEELEQVKTKVIAQQVYLRDSIENQANTLGNLESVGLSWKLIDEEQAYLQSVTPADIQKAARTYFTRERLSVAHLLPEETANE